MSSEQRQGNRQRQRHRQGAAMSSANGKMNAANGKLNAANGKLNAANGKLNTTNSKMSTANSKLNTALLFIIASILIGTILRFTAGVFIPFAIAIIFSYILNPVLQLLRRRLRFPQALAVLVVMLLFVAVSVLVGYVLYSSVRSLVARYPVYEERFSVMIANLAERYNLTDVSPGQFIESLGVQDALRGVLISLSGGSISFLSGLVLVAIFLLFLLLERGVLVANITTALSREQGVRVQKIIKDVNMKVGRYMSAKLIISLCTAVVVYVSFTLIGVDVPFVWAMLTFLFNFIPNIGSILITLLASLFALIQFAPQWGAVILTAGIMTVTQLTFGNIIEPRVVGKNLNINTVVIILSLLIWATIWGVAGAFLSVPMTVLLISILDAIPLTKPVSALLGVRKKAKGEKGG